ncbi:hypothetical protein NQ314_021213 [Rhamnusium bicolor]|uniref:BRCT domain-containing protein n=1 Tax=Rhamnusium bicolor TaxID=1586634 RepID=A0AAV8WI22_9CUCU|nr:hypothetical protein NQ314_021213 [Rhamnusium bicolor]
MPKINIDHVISFSSEDPIHIASNILSNDTSKKWKCRTPGEKTAVVFLQLEKASVITGVDIGNEHSAYIEVLVSRSGMNGDYNVLLVASSFMTPLEARQSQNVNKVRMFTKEHFSKPECDEKWDRVKVVCTQPFNRHVQYGLSFINIHTSDVKILAPIQTHIGKFILRPESPDNLSAGSLFEKRKEIKDEKLSALYDMIYIGAAAIREASSSASLAKHGSPVCKPKLKTLNSTPSSRRESSDNSEKTPRPRNRDDLLYSKDEEEPNEKIDKIIEKKKSPRSLDTSAGTSGDSKNKAGSAKEYQNDRKRKNKNEAGKKDQNKKMKKDVNTKPFERLLEGVTLVISGVQNPYRGNLRTSALSMGAKYKPDWDDSCTHLIQRKRKNREKEWIEDCWAQKKRFPWRRYALDKRDIGKDESEDEICAKIEPTYPVYENIENSDSEMDYSEHKDYASDTEERIARIQERNKENEKNSVYTADTDEEDQAEKTSSALSNKLMNLFINKTFYIDQSFDEDVYNKLLKYIVAYDGKSVDDPTRDVDVIITVKENSQTLKEINANAVCLNSDWVWDCHNSQKLVPMDQYVY